MSWMTTWTKKIFPWNLINKYNGIQQKALFQKSVNDLDRALYHTF